MSKSNQQAGFTIIELIVVIVILGILAATALPKFVDLSSDAKQAAAQGVAGAAASAYTLNFSGCSVKNHKPTTDKCVKVVDCTNVGSLLQGGVPAGYAVTASGVPPAVKDGEKFECQVNPSPADSAVTAVGVPAIMAGNK